MTPEKSSISEKPELYVIDGTGYVFRAFHAVRSRLTADGRPTNAIFGFTQMFERLLREDRPEALAVVFDAKGENFRHALYPAYKANRDAPPEELAEQFVPIVELVKSYGARVFQIPGVEADDVIATLVEQARAAGRAVTVVSSDKDLMQLVGGSVRMLDPGKYARIGPDEVKAKLRVLPEKVADLLALMGDSSDNVPGVHGVGPVKAAQCLDSYGDLEGVIQAAIAGQIKGKLGEWIRESEAEARLSRQLVALKTDVPLGLDSLDDLSYAGPDYGRLLPVFKALEFRRMIEKCEAQTRANTPEAKALKVAVRRIDPSRYRLIQSVEALDALAEALKKAEVIGLWAPLLEADPEAPTLLGLGIYEAEIGGVYVPLNHLHQPEDLTEARVLERLGPILAADKPAKVGAKLKGLSNALLALNHGLSGLRFDLEIAAYLLHPEETGREVDQLSLAWLDHTKIPLKPLTEVEVINPKTKKPFKKKRQRSLDAVEPEALLPVAGEEAEVVSLLEGVLQPELEKAGLWELMETLEMPLLAILAKMESYGLLVDVKALKKMSRDLEKEIGELEAKIYQAAGQEFLLTSTQQLQKVLFEDLELNVIKSSKRGHSTDQSVLEALIEDHPVPGLLLEHRQLSRLKSTYADALPRQIRQQSHRVHTRLNQSVAQTGRLSSTDPNLQNIPVRTPLGRKLREAFIAPEGSRLVSVDYSQVELRVLAHLSGDAVLMKAFQEGADVHTRTASVLFELPEAEVTREHRSQAKAVNFGVLYGMGPVRLARQLGIDRKLASRFIKDYFARQPGVKQYLDEVLELAKEKGEVRTLLGRRRIIQNLNSQSRALRQAAERVATNTPIQGSAADLIKLAMIRVDAALTRAFPAAKMLLQVHDELLIECPEAEAEAVAALVKREMEAAYTLRVPLVASASVGRNWDEAH